MLRLNLWAAAVFTGVSMNAADLASPNLIIFNAKVRTMDPAQPLAGAVAVTFNRISLVGSTQEILARAGVMTVKIDAQGALLLPGFNDAHLHFLSGGFQLSQVDLRSAKNPAEFAQRIGRFAETLPPGAWVTGGDWDHESWPDSPLPTRQMIDAVVPDRPVFVRRLDGHMAVANSAALKLAGVTRDSRSPDGGMIVTDAHGEPTGLLKDAAMSLVYRMIPPESFEQKLAAAKAASEHAASLGVTSAQDMSAGRDIRVYQELHRRGELKTRLYAMSPLSEWDRVAGAGLTAPFGDEMLRFGGLKGFSDGSLGSSTAWFFEDYNDSPGNTGLPSDEMFPEGAMARRVLAAADAGLQVMVHAIGDKANDHVLSLFAEVSRKFSVREHRFRIEHAQHLRLADIPRFAQHRVIASMQPYHVADDGRWAEKRIGSERGKGTYAFRSLLDAGAAVAFGSDWTVAPLNPLLGIHAAVTRQTLDGKHPEGWVPEQKITAHEAVYAYTMGSAFAEFAEQDKGSITPGKLSDLVLVDRDFFAKRPAEILQAKVILTILDGKIVYRSAEKELRE